MKKLSLFSALLLFSLSLTNANNNKAKFYLIPTENEEQLFERKMREAAARLSVPSEWLFVLTFGESANKANAKNKKGTASGIIQMTDATAREYGTTAARLRNMSRVQQVPYVERFYKKGIDRFGKFKTLTQMKVYTLLPAQTPNALNDWHKLMVNGDKYYSKNKSFDTNKNGIVHVFEIKELMTATTKLWREYKRKRAM